ncbi:MAG: TonB-dependent receptor [Prevotella sp.]|nr:TonB-dependent receptor [Prevotella sp.]
MYKPQFNKRRVLVFHQFGNKGWSLFSCLGREVVCSVLSVSTLTYASAESISTQPVTADTVATTTARELTLDEVSVTGSRAPLTKSQAARMVTVLDRADIQQAPVQSINDLLKYAVGVDVRQRGPIGAQTDITMRGGTQEQIIILLNGINICDPQTGHNVLDLPVDLSDILRIEVLEGPAGRIYGTSSLVGAINIVTEKKLKQVMAQMEGGSFGYAKVSFKYDGISASYARSDGYSRCKAGGLNSDFSGAKAFYQGHYRGENSHVSWHLGLTDKGWGSATAYASPKWQADDQYEHTTKLLADIQSDTRCGALNMHANIYWNQHQDRYEGYRGRPDLLKYNYNRTDVFGLSLNSYFDWVAGRTAFGAELRNENLLSGNLGEPLTRPHHINGTDRDYTLGLNRTNISGFVEHNVLLRNLTVSAGLVVVKNTWTDMNPTIYPGIDASLRLNRHWQLHASYNTSLRMPSFTEMYYKLQGYAANPHLKPEEMQAIEAGASFNASHFTFHTALWRHYGRNMIDWIMDTRQGDDATWQSVNHTRLNSVGIEASAEYKVRRATFNISYSYIDQEKDLEQGVISQYALEYLRHKLVAGLYLPLYSDLWLKVSLRWQDRVGQYTDFDGSVCDYEPYALADTRLSWQKPAYELYAEADNLLDTTYRDYGLVPQPGRWLIAGIRLKL